MRLDLVDLFSLLRTFLAIIRSMGIYSSLSKQFALFSITGYLLFNSDVLCLTNNLLTSSNYQSHNAVADQGFG